MPPQYERSERERFVAQAAAEQRVDDVVVEVRRARSNGVRRLHRARERRGGLRFRRHAGNRQPGLRGQRDLPLRAADEEPASGIVKRGARRLRHRRDPLGIGGDLALDAEQARQLHHLPVAVQQHAVHRGRAVEGVVPVDEDPHRPRVGEQPLGTHVAADELELALHRRPELARRGQVSRRAHVLENRDPVEDRVVRDVLVALEGGRLLVDARGYGAVLTREGGEQVEAALHQRRVVEGRVVRERLQAQVAGPEPLVAPGAVLERGLHAVAQGRRGHLVDATQVLRHAGRQRGQGRVGRGHRVGANVLEAARRSSASVSRTSTLT